MLYFYLSGDAAAADAADADADDAATDFEDLILDFFDNRGV